MLDTFFTKFICEKKFEVGKIWYLAKKYLNFNDDPLQYFFSIVSGCDSKYNVNYLLLLIHPRYDTVLQFCMFFI